MAEVKVTYYYPQIIKVVCSCTGMICLLLKVNASHVLGVSVPLASLASSISLHSIASSSAIKYALIFLIQKKSNIKNNFLLLHCSSTTIQSLFTFTNKFLDSTVYTHCLYFLNSHAFLNPLQTSFGLHPPSVVSNLLLLFHQTL